MMENDDALYDEDAEDDWDFADGDRELEVDDRWKYYYVVEDFTYTCPFGLTSQLRIALVSGEDSVLAAEVWRDSDQS